MAEHREILHGQSEDSGVVDSVVSFAKGFWHGAIESPINGAIQVANHAASSHIPELDLVDSKNLTAAGQVGSTFGTAVDVIALAYATRSIGGRGVASTAMRAAAVGALYGGIFQPSDGNSRTFLADRLGNAAVGGVTALAGFGTAYGLDKTGAFAVPAARSLFGSIVYGAATGAGSGVGYAEANAVFKQGRLLPTYGDLMQTVQTFAAYGALGGAMGYAYERAANPAPKEFVFDSIDKMKVWYDKDGKPYRVRAFLDEAPGNYGSRHEVSDEALMTNGQWKTKYLSGGHYKLPADIRVDADGTVHFGGRSPSVTLKPDGNYEIRSKHWFGESGPREGGTRIQTPEGRQLVSDQGKVMSMQRYADAQFNDWKFKDLPWGTTADYAKSGQLERLSAYGLDGNPNVELHLNPNGTYKLSTIDTAPYSNYLEFQWKGSVKSVDTPGSVMKHLEFSPENGRPFSFGMNTDTKVLADGLRQSAQPLPASSNGAAK